MEPVGPRAAGIRPRGPSAWPAPRGVALTAPPRVFTGGRRWKWTLDYSRPRALVDSAPTWRRHGAANPRFRRDALATRIGGRRLPSTARLKSRLAGKPRLKRVSRPARTTAGKRSMYGLAQARPVIAEVLEPGQGRVRMRPFPKARARPWLRPGRHRRIRLFRER
jgi:hypothetical protein